MEHGVVVCAIEILAPVNERTGSWDKLRCMHAFSVSTGTREGGREGGRLVAGGATRLSFGSVRAAGFWA